MATRKKLPRPPKKVIRSCVHCKTKAAVGEGIELRGNPMKPGTTALACVDTALCLMRQDKLKTKKRGEK